EALKNPLNAIRTNARPIVIDSQDNVLAASRQREPDLPGVFWHERARILNEVGHDLTKPQVVPRHNEVATVLLIDLYDDLDLLFLAAYVLCCLDEVLNKPLHINRLCLFSHELSIKA